MTKLTIKTDKRYITRIYANGDDAFATIGGLRIDNDAYDIVHISRDLSKPDGTRLNVQVRDKITGHESLHYVGILSGTLTVETE